MKKMTCRFCALPYVLFLFLVSPAGIAPAFADAEITNHMMTRNPQWDTGCSTPIPTDSFDYTDAEANCWFAWDHAPATDEIACQWYKPDGELYAEQKNLTFYPMGCWYSRILINGYAPEKIPGEWQVKVYFAGVLKFTERFTLHGDPSTDQCPAELLYGKDSEETALLRYWRDACLRGSAEGREMIALYYRYSPVIAQVLGDDEELQAAAKAIADAVLAFIQGPAQRKE